MRVTMLKTAYRAVVVVVLLSACVALAHADATFLLQEPYGHFGGLSPTGHAAIYLSRICAESPTVLRLCAPGETGVVISRYRKIGGFDWIAIPLIPYLYAVEESSEIPSAVDADTANFLRDQYRHTHLADLVPDRPDGERPDGPWVELIGAAYNRKIYAFQIETTEEQDSKLLGELNSHPNKARFNLLFKNCADFASHIMNFYLPHAVRRSFIADMGLMTPKQVARSLVKYNKKNSDLQLWTYIVPQVPGSIDRSRPVRGVTESLFKSKKYGIPLALFHPFVAGGVLSAYVVKGRFNPAHEAVLIDPTHELNILAQTRVTRTHSQNLDSQPILLGDPSAWGRYRFLQKP
jgi:hypothetical protein